MRIRAMTHISPIYPERDHAGISVNCDYFVIGIDPGFFRIVNDDGHPVLYPIGLFEVMDKTIPQGWCYTAQGSEDYSIEPCVIKQGTFEDFFFSDGDRDAQIRAQKILSDYLGETL